MWLRGCASATAEYAADGSAWIKACNPTGFNVDDGNTTFNLLVIDAQQFRRDTRRAMSQENVELVCRGYDAFNRGDMDAAFELLDPGIEWSEGADVPEPQVYYGHDGVRRQQERFRESWENFSIEPEEFIEAGDRLVVIVKLVGRGKGSGIDVEARGAHVWTVRDGKAVRLEMYLDKSAALEAVGLSE